MAHEIDTTTGRASFAYTGQAPWHGLGKQLPEGAVIRLVIGQGLPDTGVDPRVCLDADMQLARLLAAHAQPVSQLAVHALTLFLEFLDVIAGKREGINILAEEEIAAAPATLADKTEQEALIAYLQGLGTQIKSRN